MVLYCPVPGDRGANNQQKGVETMKRMKRVLSLALCMALALSLTPAALAYNAPASDATGGLTGLEMAQKVAEEGMVLLENRTVTDESGGSEKALPLKQGESVAIFGINQIDFIWGGGGSGNFSSDNTDHEDGPIGYVSLYDGLKEKETEGKISIYNDLYNTYKKYYDDYWKNDGRTYGYGTTQGAVIMYGGEMAVTQEQVDAAAKSATTAIITIGRPAGEDNDRKATKGDFLLSDNEVAMINYVKQAGFKKVIAILNVTGVIESDWFAAENSGVDAALMVSLPGMWGGKAMADVLVGDAYPSGKLVDTWANNLNDYPSTVQFGSNAANPVYTEDIFVGYRYFETIPGAAEKANYEFGYGQSYADFAITNPTATVSGSGRDRTVNISATVTNNGTMPGKEVVQVYYSAPEGKLTQPKRELAAFVKTGELAAGESENVTMSFKFDDMASYDDLGATGHEAAYVLEAGAYDFYVGSSVRDNVKAGAETLSALEVVEQLEHHLVPDLKYISQRMKSDGTMEPLKKTVNAPVSTDPAEDVDAAYKAIYTDPEVAENADAFITFQDVAKAFTDGNETAEDTALLHAFIARMSDAEIAKLTGCVDPDADKGHRTAIGGIPVYGLPKIGTSNGPAGIQYNGTKHTYETTTTFYPCATMQASTWNVELIEQLGAAMGNEARHFGMSLWQAPGMNIHRNPMGGRNFEYFAEDPYLTGRMGVAITNGVQSQKFASQLKHFACNSQENNRWDGDSRVSERALREIYLKGYEIAIKEAQPWSVMSSYNHINGTHSTHNYQLLTEVLRNEWGFEGFVFTDFYDRTSHVSDIPAGGDVKAPHSSASASAVVDAIQKGDLERWQVQRSAERTVRFLLKTQPAYDLAGSDTFDYIITIAFNVDGIEVRDDSIVLANAMNWGEFKDAINNIYNQTYVLKDSSGNPVTDDTASIERGMTLLVTAEDNATTKTYTFTSMSVARNKTVKASYTEGDNTAAKAVDGDMNTRWSAYGDTWNDKNTGVYNWIEVDLGKVYHLSQIDVSYHNGNSRSFTYEIWARAEERDDWGETARSRDFSAAGYDKIVADKRCANVVTDSNAVTKDARYVAVKTTSPEYAVSIRELDIYGWAISSDEFKIDEENKIIYVPAGGVGTGEVTPHITVEGNATVKFNFTKAFVEEGDSVTVTPTGGTPVTYSFKYSPIMTQPDSTKVIMAGDKDTLSINAYTGSTFQWYQNTTASNEGGTAIDGATASTLEVGGNTTGTFYYYCVVSNNGMNDAASRVITVTVTDNLAMAKNIKANFSEGGRDAKYAVDGRSDTYWSTYQCPEGTSGSWIEVDLGEPYHLSQAEIAYHSGTSRSFTFDIWGRTEEQTGAQWDENTDKERNFSAEGYTKLASGSSANLASKTQNLSGYVRYVLIKTDSSSTVAIDELAVSGWKLLVDETAYAVNDADLIIQKKTDGAAAAEDFKLWGSGSLALSEDGSKLTVTDKTGGTTAFQILGSDSEIYSVRYDLTGLNVTGGVSQIASGSTLEVSLNAENGYLIPESVTVAMGGTELAAGTGYTYKDGRLTVPNVTGDIVITAEGQKNLALNKNAKASHVEKGDQTASGAANAVDGKMSTRWSGFSANFEYGQWLEVDLGGLCEIDRIDVSHNNGATRKYTYEMWTKGDVDSDWSNTAADRDFTAEGYSRLMDDAEGVADKIVTKTHEVTTSARYLLIKITSGWDYSANREAYGPGIYELAVYGSELGTSAPSITGVVVKKADGTVVDENTELKVYTNEDHAGHDHNHSLTLTAEVSPENAENKNVNWIRETVEGKVALSRDGNRLTITAIHNEAETNVGPVTLNIVAEGDTNVKQTITVQVIRVLENPISISINGVNDSAVAPKFGQTLEADINQLKMTDAGKAALRYQWKRDGEAITGAASKTYILTEEDIGAKISVDVTADPSTYYEGTRSAERGQAVAKADGPTIPGSTIYGVKTTTEENNDGKITGFGSDYALYEYKAKDAQEWTEVPGTEVTGLANGEYQVRVKETATHGAGAAINVTVPAYDTDFHKINIDPGMANGTVTRSVGQAGEGTTITLTVKPATGYALDELTVSTAGGTVSTDKGADVTEDGKTYETYTFAMPDEDVTVSAVFKKVKLTVIHDLTNLTCSRNGEGHSHQVEYGDTAAITLVPDEGYTLPSATDITIVNGNGDEITGWTISDSGTITITGGVTSDLTITAAGIVKTYVVNYTLTNGLSAPEAGAAREVAHKAAYTGKLVAAAGYKLPNSITVTMGGEAFTDFTYENGTVTIGGDKIIGNLVITASGIRDSGSSGDSSGSDSSSGSSSGSFSSSTTIKNPDGSTTTKTENKVTGTVTETTKWPDGSQTKVETKKDGTVTTTETDKDGNKTATVAKPDGSSVTTVAQKDGTSATVTTDTEGKVEAEVKLSVAAVSEAQKNEQTISLPIPEVKATKDTETAPAVTVNTGSKDPVKVEIPVSDPTPGTVAVLVKADGTEEIIKTSLPTETGVAVELADGATVKLVDNSKTFADVPDGNWADDAIDFVSARELFSGTSESSFSPETPMTRAMLMTVLARFDGADTAGGAIWYEKGLNWAVANGISDGTNPNGNVTREQLVTMLWRYVGSPAASGDLSCFPDASQTSSFAQEAMRWAVENGIVSGYGNGQLGPQDQATRAQVAQIMMNFIAK